MIKKYLVVVIGALCVGAGITSTSQKSTFSDVTNDQENKLLLPGHIAYACNVYDPSGGMPLGYFEFELDNPSECTPCDLIFEMAACADFDDNGDLYFIVYGGGLYRRDAQSGITYFIGPTISLNGLTHDTTSDLWYGCYMQDFYQVDITTAETVFIGSTGMTNSPIGLACDNQGTIYTYDVLWAGNSHLYSINKTTGEATVIGDMGIGCVYAQDPAYDRDNSILYIAAYTQAATSGLYICDVSTAECILVGNFPGNMEVDGFAIPYESYPVANFTWSPAYPIPNKMILFNASLSYDPNGYLILYEWDWNNDGIYDESHTDPTATHAWDTSGNYPVTLRVTNTTNSSGSVTKIVVVNHPPVPPSIQGPDNGIVFVEYTFVIDPIEDPEGDSMFVKWDWGDGNSTEWLGPFPSGQIISETYRWTHAGVYEIRAKLKDTYEAESNWSEPHMMTIEEYHPPIKPTIEGPSIGRVNVLYNFTVVIFDPEADQFYYFCDWGDGTSTGWLGPFDAGREITIAHTWNSTGTFQIQTRAKDHEGHESTSDPFVLQIVELKKSLVLGSCHYQNETEDLRIFYTNFLLLFPSDSILYSRETLVIAKEYRFGFLTSSFFGGIFEASLLLS